MIKICVIAAVILLVLILLIVVIVRRKKSKRKVRRMSMCQKIQKLNDLAEPFGFFYIPKEDVFTSRINAWQRKHGYEAFFDRAAVGFNMVADALPVYFDYEGRTWLIEFWKGQYGINTGGEVGVYHSKKLVPELFYSIAHFDAAKDEEMPCCIDSRLERKGKQVYHLKRPHWWLTGFKMGVFSKPKNLRLMTTISFREIEMAQAFYEGLECTGLPRNKFRICKNEVYVRMDFSPHLCLFERIHRCLVQLQNRLNCFLYRLVTWPFTCTVDRMLFLYYQLPSCFRRMLRIGGNCTKRKGYFKRKRSTRFLKERHDNELW